jgi:hypothetical protein
MSHEKRLGKLEAAIGPAETIRIHVAYYPPEALPDIDAWVRQHPEAIERTIVVNGRAA